MSPLIINLLNVMSDYDISFVIKKSELKPKEYGTLRVKFDNEWVVSVVDDNGEYSVQVSKDNFATYYNFKDAEVEEVKAIILDVESY